MPLTAQTTVSASGRFVYGGNIGWVDARPSEEAGARVEEHVCSGYLYSANVGWIHLGGGSPVNGYAYGNLSASDYGVNVVTSGIGGGAPGALSGYAYGANVGWIVFDAAGSPRVDLATGRLSGYAYSANVGWLHLGEFALSVSVNTIMPAPDSDGDGLSDAWELAQFPDLAVLASSGDYDGDGAPDSAEYLADTDPTDPADYFRVLAFSLDRGAVPDFAVLSFTSRPTRHYRIEFASSLAGQWTESALGRFAPGAGSFTTRAVDTWENPPAIFLRVRAERPLAP